ncbi:DNA polymerase III subunit gamma/tau, partial [Candidatus Dependentiae bacterium]|nr:DNA polymerase III subunit gamma/tau [Candidatus Dependentiae bacterium]
MKKKEKKYEVFSRKYRPVNFDEVIGQEHITTTLKNALGSGHIAHAYLFTGPRGIGKTSTARIFAKALNCEKGPTTKPCNTCDFCLEINNGSSLDVIEIDGASNTSVDNIREIKQNVLFISRPGKKKIYIIDEVHQISSAGFNALLKTLEEPPEYVIFIFATTEAQKIPLTILSRCQRFDFRRISVKLLVEQLKRIVKIENIKISDEALHLIGEKADGSMRDAEVLLDQLISTTDKDILPENIRQLFGMVDFQILYDFLRTFISKDIKKGLEIIDALFIKGNDISIFLEDLLKKTRNLMFLKINPNLKQAIYLSERERKIAIELSKEMDISLISSLSQKLIELLNQIKYSSNPRILFEHNYIYSQNLQTHISLSEIMDKLDNFTGKGFLADSNSESPVSYEEAINNNTPVQPAPVKSPEKNTVNESQEEFQTDPGYDWKGFLKFLDEKKTSLFIYLENSELASIDSSIITIGFSSSEKFKREYLDKPDKKSELEKYIFQYFQLKREIKFQVQGDI